MFTGPEALRTPRVPLEFSKVSLAGRTTLLPGSIQVSLKLFWYCALTVSAMPKNKDSMRMLVGPFQYRPKCPKQHIHTIRTDIPVTF